MHLPAQHDDLLSYPHHVYSTSFDCWLTYRNEDHQARMQGCRVTFILQVLQLTETQSADLQSCSYLNRFGRYPLKPGLASK